MPWLLIVLVAATTAAAVESSTMTERLIALGVAETIVVGYFGVAMYRLRRARRPRDVQAGGVEAGERSPV